MIKNKLPAGTIHNKLPKDMQKRLAKGLGDVNLWKSLTPLARNEFICWVDSAKQAETRKRRIKRSVEELNEGKRRPCCWIGCVHRNDKEVSPSVKGILSRRKN